MTSGANAAIVPKADFPGPAGLKVLTLTSLQSRLEDIR
jgi:hypothetical protein